MQNFLRLIRLLRLRKSYLLISVLFQILAALFTIISIPFVIPFFQILFGLSPSSYMPPTGVWDLEGSLNYYFSRLIAISDRPTALVVICWVVIGIFMLRNVFRYLSSYFLIPAINGVITELRSGIFFAYQRMTVSQRNANKKGRLLSLMSNDLAVVDHGIMKAIELVFKAPLVMAGSLTFMIWISPVLSLIALVLIAFIFLVIGGLNRKLKLQSGLALSSLDNIQIMSDEYLQAKKVVDAYEAKDFFYKRFERANGDYFAMMNSILRRRDLASPSTEFLAIVTVVILLYYGAQLVFRGAMEPPTFFAFIFAFYQIIDPAKSFSRESANVSRGIAALDRINRFTDQSIEPPEGDGLSIGGFNEIIRFEGVGFGYGQSADQILKKITLNIKKGQHLGLVGLSGAGKTTLVDLLLQLYPVEYGEITLDGKPIAQYNKRQYRKMFGLVSQDAVLFHASIRENVVLDRPWDTQAFEHALRCSESYEFVNDRPSGAEAVIGDRGVRLSGGEQQRLTIARAIYGKPEVLILDEPTSSLDLKADFKVRQALFTAMKGRTAIMISHNPELLKEMDGIIVLHDGQIVQEGTYEALSSENGLFKELIDFQNRKINT